MSNKIERGTPRINHAPKDVAHAKQNVSPKREGLPDKLSYRNSTFESANTSGALRPRAAPPWAQQGMGTGTTPTPPPPTPPPPPPPPQTPYKPPVTTATLTPIPLTQAPAPPPDPPTQTPYQSPITTGTPTPDPVTQTPTPPNTQTNVAAGASFMQPISTAGMPAAAQTAFASSIRNGTIDLNQVTAQQLLSMAPADRQAFFDWLGNQRGGAQLVIAANPGNPESPVLPQPTGDLRNALALKLFNSAPSAGLFTALNSIQPPATGLLQHFKLDPKLISDISLQGNPSALAMVIDAYLKQTQGNAGPISSSIDSLTNQMLAGGLTDSELTTLSTLFQRHPSAINGDRLAKLMSAAIASGGQLTGDEARKLGGVTEAFFRSVDAGNQASVQQALQSLLQGISSYLPQPMSPMNAGLVTGIVGAGMMKHIAEIAASSSEATAWLNALTWVVGGSAAAAAGPCPPLAAGIAALTPIIAQMINDGGNPPTQEAVRKWLGDAQLAWIQNASSYGWQGPNDGILAAEAAESVIRANGLSP